MIEQTIVEDTKTGGKKSTSPDRYDLIPPRALEQLALVYGANCKDHGGKYEARNWEKGYSWGQSFRALIKHAFAAWRGEWIDPTDGHPHMAKVAWHALTLLTYHDYHLGTDDRSTLNPRS